MEEERMRRAVSPEQPCHLWPVRKVQEENWEIHRGKGDAGGSCCCARDTPPSVQGEPKRASYEFPIGCRAAVWCPRSRFASPVGYN